MRTNLWSRWFEFTAALCSLPLNRCTLSPGWVRGQHRQDSRSMSSARNSNLPGRAQESECCQTTDKWHYAATQRSLRSAKSCKIFSVQQLRTSPFYIYPTFVGFLFVPFVFFVFKTCFSYTCQKQSHLTGNRMWSEKKHADVPLALHTVQSLLVSGCAPHRSAGSPTSVEDDDEMNVHLHPSVAPSTHFVIVLTGFRSLCA